MFVVLVGIGILLVLLGAAAFIYMLVKRIKDDSEGSVKMGTVELKIPGAAFMCFLGLVAIGGGIYFGPNSTGAEIGPGSAISSSSPQEVPVGPSPSSAIPTFSFDQPTEGAPVRGDFTLLGKSPDLKGDVLWIFVQSESPSGGRVYYKTSEAPVPVEDGSWATTQSNLGGDGDVGIIFTLVAVRANPTCSNAVIAVQPDSEGNLIVGQNLPEGCLQLGVRHVKKVG
jgi:hypothetical protein